MAKGKKSFLLYTDQIGLFEKLSDEDAGRLIKFIFNYVNDRNPETQSQLIEIAFEPIKLQLKRDLKKWDKYIKKQRVNGSKGGRPTKNPSLTQKTQAFFQKPKKADNVNDTVTDNVTNTENTGPLANANFFRKPTIPTKQQVLEKIIAAGGTKEMAKAFYEKYEGTGWFLNGSPVVNFIPLAQKFITNWKTNHNGNSEPEQDFTPSRKI